MKEKQLTNKFRKYLDDLIKNDYPVKYLKIWGGGRYQKVGIPDFICCINGIYFEVELKSSTGKPSKLQEYHIRTTNSANGMGLILYPDGFGKFKKIVKEVLKCDFHTVELSAIKCVHTDTSCDTLTKYELYQTLTLKTD